MDFGAKAFLRRRCAVELSLESYDYVPYLLEA